MISLSIESAQLFISLILRYNFRSFSVDDLILNTFGGILGYVAYKIFVLGQTFTGIGQNKPEKG